MPQRGRKDDTVIEPGRLSRAVHLEAVRVDADSFLVRGGSQDHVVQVVDGEVRCDCMDSQVRSGDNCKHCLTVKLLAGDPDVVRALRQLIPAPRKAKALT